MLSKFFLFNFQENTWRVLIDLFFSLQIYTQLLRSYNKPKIDILKLNSMKLYLIKFSEKESGNIKICCINIHLNIGLFTVEKYCICKLLYMTFTPYCTIFKDLDVSRIHRNK